MTNRDQDAMNNSNPTQMNRVLCTAQVFYSPDMSITCCQGLLRLSDLKDDGREEQGEKKQQNKQRHQSSRRGEAEPCASVALVCKFAVSRKP